MPIRCCPPEASGAALRSGAVDPACEPARRPAALPRAPVGPWAGFVRTPRRHGRPRLTAPAVSPLRLFAASSARHGERRLDSHPGIRAAGFDPRRPARPDVAGAFHARPTPNRRTPRTRRGHLHVSLMLIARVLVGGAARQARHVCGSPGLGHRQPFAPRTPRPAPAALRRPRVFAGRRAAGRTADADGPPVRSGAFGEPGEERLAELAVNRSGPRHAPARPAALQFSAVCETRRGAVLEPLACASGSTP